MLIFSKQEYAMVFYVAEFVCCGLWGQALHTGSYEAEKTFWQTSRI